MYRRMAQRFMPAATSTKHATACDDGARTRAPACSRRVSAPVVSFVRVKQGAHTPARRLRESGLLDGGVW